MSQIEFNYENVISYEDYSNIIKDLKKWYLPQYNKIIKLYEDLLKRRNYSETFKIIHEHNEIILELLNMLIDKLQLRAKNIGIYLSNSFAKECNLLDSDIDINFIYNNKELYIYEELFESILYQVLGKYRDFIHDSISHRLIDNKDNSEVEYKLKFDSKTIYEKITNGNEAMMYNLFNTKKDLNSFFKYYTEKINSADINEWIYFQKPLNGNASLLLNYIKKSVISSTPYLNHDKVKQLKKNMLIEIEELNNINTNDISIFKKYYKNHAFKYICYFLTLLYQENNDFDFLSVEKLLHSTKDDELIKSVEQYYGLIMIFNLLCNKYNIEFRTRYSNPITEEFTTYIKNNFGENLIELVDNKLEKIYNLILLKLNKIKYNKPEYDITLEHINIENYSPLSKINNSSPCYQDGVYLLPFIKIDNNLIPIHPDTLDDLNISREDVIKYEIVAPTSSTRTVFSLNEKKYYKLALTRQITRSIRDLKDKELKRSEIAQRELDKVSNSNLTILKEECFYGKEEIYNYIVREYPDRKLYPWFYLIVTNTFSKEDMLEITFKMIDIWLSYASCGIYFESAHTQNFLIDNDLNIYYRDLSDIRILKYDIMKPSYMDQLKDLSELHSIFFDRSMLSQNIEHFINNYNDITIQDIQLIKGHLKNSIIKYNIDLPNYSMNYSRNKEGHCPEKCKLNRLRDLNN